MDFSQILSKTQIEDNKEYTLEGRIHPQKSIKRPLPKKGKIASYILTSAQNNTVVIEPLLKNIKVLAKHLDAEIIVSPLNYKKNLLNTAGERVSTEKGGGVTFDSIIQEYLTMDRVELSPEAVFYGDMGFGITARNPLTSIDRLLSGDRLHNVIIPSNKIQMESIPQSSKKNIEFPIGTYSTGTITALNFIDSKTGKISENETDYGCLLVQVDSEGVAFIYQIEANKENFDIQFATIAVRSGKIYFNVPVEGLVLGDIHSVNLTEKKIMSVYGYDGLIDKLKVKQQVMHDVLDQYACNHHHEGDDILGMVKHHKKTNNLYNELKDLRDLLEYASSVSKVVVVESNHDNALVRYLKRVDVRKDYENSLLTSSLLHDLIGYTLYSQSVDTGVSIQEINESLYDDLNFYKKDVIPMTFNGKSMMFIEFIMMRTFSLNIGSKLFFLSTDDEYEIEGVFIPYHGDKGVNGARGGASLRKIPQKIVIGHTHSPYIRGNLWCGGVTSDIDKFDYISGASSWRPSHVAIYKGGMRCMLLERNGKYFHG